VTKQREYECSGEFTFTLKVVELGENKRGKMLTSCVVTTGEERTSEEINPRRRLSGHQKRALEVLENLAGASGREGDPGVPSGCRSVPEKWWRDRFYESAMPGAETDTKKKAFVRASTQLIENHIVGMATGRVWIVSKTVTSRDIRENVPMSRSDEVG
jgi:hypothetical protein